MAEPVTLALLVKLYRIANLTGLMLERENAENEASTDRRVDDVRLLEGKAGRA